MWKSRYLTDIYQLSKQSFVINVIHLIYPSLGKKTLHILLSESDFKDFRQFCNKGRHM